MKTPKAIVIVSSIVNDEICSSAVLFESWDEALAYARKDADNYRHLTQVFVEKVGRYKNHAYIKMHGTYINKKYTISDLSVCKDKKSPLDIMLNTYAKVDFVGDGMI